MKHIYTVSTSVAAAGVGIALGAAVLTGGGSTQQQIEPANQVVREAPQYAGDPWETRFREQFWTGQHIHDSWNRCHLGETVSEALRNAPGC